jgi:stage II sporulation protein AA (anti-sigma F factor antagonist)
MIVHSADSILVSARGDLDLATAPALDAALCEVEARSPRVAVDLRALTFMDSSGINLLMRHVARAESDGFVLAVIPPRPPVMRVLDIAGVLPLLPIIDGPANRAPADGNS